MPYLLVLGLAAAWQSGVTWAPWALGIVLALLAIYAWREILTRRARPKPEGYVGKFRRADGSVVHVARMASGRLWAASDTQPPENLGYVEGRDLMRWQKLATTPDG